MKPSVPEKGTVVRLEGENAVVMMDKGESCKGCGAGKVGLCRSGFGSMFLTAGNALGAQPGDIVEVGLARSVQVRGYCYAYLIPLASFLGGAALGHIIGPSLSIPALDVISAFFLFGAVSTVSLIRLRRLDRTQKLVVGKVLSGPAYRAELQSEEAQRYAHCGSAALPASNR